MTRFSCLAHKAVVVSSLVVLVTTLLSTQASAQSSESAGKGRRVRLVVPTVSPKPLIGTIVRSDETSVVLSQGLWQGASVELMVVPRNAITKMEVSSGRRSHAKAGALIGAAALAFAVAVTPDSSCSGIVCVDYPKELGVAVAAVLGAGLGALIGKAFTKSETWTPVPPGLQVSVTPKHKGGVVSLSFAF
jgi:hypothetical protein